jgi:hypothetical protein
MTTPTKLPTTDTAKAAFAFLRDHGYGPDGAAELAGKIEAQPSNSARVAMAMQLGWRWRDAVAWLRGCGYYGASRRTG